MIWKVPISMFRDNASISTTKFLQLINFPHQSTSSTYSYSQKNILRVIILILVNTIKQHHLTTKKIDSSTKLYQQVKIPYFQQRNWWWITWDLRMQIFQTYLFWKRQLVLITSDIFLKENIYHWKILLVHVFCMFVKQNLF